MNPSMNIIVIGAGPAGMMAAIRAAECADGVALFEKNASAGRKLGLTGKGRCNLTNVASCDDFLDKFGREGQFLRDAIKKLSSERVMDFFESNGLKLKVERQGRVFPETDSSRSVIDILERVLKRRGVNMFFSSAVRNILVADGCVKGVRLADMKEIRAKKIILACGGASYPETGSTGDGFRMAHDLGHCITDIFAGLVPLETEEAFVKDLQGLTLKNISIVFELGKKKVASGVGELLFTHFGVSGPLVLDLSSKVVGLSKGKPFKLFIDLKPGLSGNELEEKLEREFSQGGSLAIKNYLKELVPERLGNVVLSNAKIEPLKKCHQISAVERKSLVNILKRFHLVIKKPRPLSEAMVTCGGVSLKEVDPRTMESKIAKGMYLCGEVLDLSASSGGYNLQAAFSTGYMAGEAAGLSCAS